MFRDLNEIERQFLQKLLSPKFKVKEELVSQLSVAKVKSTFSEFFVVYKFYFASDVIKFPYNLRVPVEMIAYQSKSAPIEFLLHLKNGVMGELEIFAADSSKLNIEQVDIQTVTFDIDSTLLS